MADFDIKVGFSVSVPVGPILGEDGKPDTTTALTNADFQILRGGTWQALNTTATATPLATGGLQGTRMVTLDTTDVGTLGLLAVEVKKATLASPLTTCMVMTALAWDALYAASGGKIPASVAAGDGVDAAYIKQAFETVT